ncbi:class I SAM-dependent methyltransferase [Salisaeta longa]|uniref:class I SAM-dependent methyltransferase n=1 Tax=Salisaeta longa TaxID=503170 RepID=UPI0003FD1CBF|nr:class I SAM-dependent methyltransferase [Salisaeta longa]
MPDRPSSTPDFWDARYRAQAAPFGTQPAAIVRQQAHRIAPGSAVVGLGAGDARSLVALAHAKECTCTAVDFSRAALDRAAAAAAAADTALETIHADLRTWSPPRRWDVALATFVQLLPHERPALYAALRNSVRPGGWMLGAWFRPAHLEGSFDRVGPTRPDRMVPPAELRAAFAADRVVQCEPIDGPLDEGGFLAGRAATVHLAVQRSGD